MEHICWKQKYYKDQIYRRHTTLIKKDAEEIKEILRRIKIESRNLVLKLNRSKTNIMVINRDGGGTAEITR